MSSKLPSLLRRAVLSRCKRDNTRGGSHRETLRLRNHPPRDSLRDPAALLTKEGSLLRIMSGWGAGKERNYCRIAVSLWTQVTASEPSPTAKPTRLVEPDRMSPAARIPGTVVSSGQGSRLVSGQRPDFIASTPVST